MVFGWGAKKKPQPVEDVAVREVRLSDIPPILSELDDVRSAAIISEARSFRNSTVPRLDQLFRIASELERETINPEDVDRRLRGLVARGKRQVISIIKAETSRAVVSVDTVEDVRTLAADIAHPIKRIGDVLGRHSRVIHVFAKREAGKLKSTLAAISSDRDEFFKSVKNFESFREGIDEIRQTLDRIADLESEGAATEERAAQMRLAVEQLGAKEREGASRIEEITSSPGYARYQQAREDLERERREGELVRQRVEAQFTRISRPLSKYFYVSSMDKGMLSFLEQMVSDPFKAIRSRPRDDTVKILAAVRKGILSGSVSVKNQDKSLSQIDDTVEMLDGFLRAISEHAARYRSIEARMAEFDSSGLERERADLERNRREAGECRDRIASLGTEAGDLVAQRGDLLSRIEFLLGAVSPAKYALRDAQDP